MGAGSANVITGLRESTTDIGSPSLWPGLPVEHCEPRWYAVYTSANHEKRVAEQLELRAVEHFLPSYASLRRWKDRRVTLQLPLFPGYVFVRMALRNRLQVIQIRGVVKLVGFGATPTALPQEDIDALRSGLADGVKAEPHPYLNVGRRVHVKHGPLAGMRGILLRWKRNWRVVLSLDLIQRSVAVDVDASTLEPVAGK